MDTTTTVVTRKKDTHTSKIQQQIHTHMRTATSSHRRRLSPTAPGSSSRVPCRRKQGGVQQPCGSGGKQPRAERHHSRVSVSNQHRASAAALSRSVTISASKSREASVVTFFCPIFSWVWVCVTVCVGVCVGCVRVLVVCVVCWVCVL